MSIFDKLFNAVRMNDDFDDDDEFFDEDELEALEEEKPKRRFFKKLEDDFDDDDFEEEEYEPVKTTKKTFTQKTEKEEKTIGSKSGNASSKITPMRNRRTGGSANMFVSVIRPTSMEDTRDIADTLLERSTVVLNLEGIDVDLAQRIIDFTSGACYYGGGSLQKVSSYIFILTPSNVEISGDFQEILNGALDMSAMHQF